jgi:tetratricopeptide (TPR) repeat protein
MQRRKAMLKIFIGIAILICFLTIIVLIVGKFRKDKNLHAQKKLHTDESKSNKCLQNAFINPELSAELRNHIAELLRELPRSQVKELQKINDTINTAFVQGDLQEMKQIPFSKFNEGVISSASLHLAKNTEKDFQIALGILRKVDQMYASLAKLDSDTPQGFLVARAEIWNQLGVVHKRKGEYQSARKYYEKALDVASDRQNKRLLAEVHLHLGTVDWETGRKAEAITKYEAALQLARTVGHKKIEGLALSSLGFVHEDDQKAVDCLEAAVMVLSDLITSKDVAAADFDLDIEHQLGRVYYNTGVRLHQMAFNNRHILTRDKDRGYYNKAIKHYKKAIPLYEKFGDSKGAANARENLQICERNIQRIDSDYL